MRKKLIPPQMNNIKFQETQFDRQLGFPSRVSYYDTKRSGAVPVSSLITRSLEKDKTMQKIEEILNDCR